MGRSSARNKAPDPIEKAEESLRLARHKRQAKQLRIQNEGVPPCPEPGCSLKKLGYQTVIEDVRQGKYVCTRCGLCLGTALSDGSEWRNFGDSDSRGADPNRVGHATDYLNENDLGTAVGSTDPNNRLAKAQITNVQDSSQRKLLLAFKRIRQNAERMNLPEDVQRLAQELFKQVETTGFMKGRKVDTLVATCIYIAAKACRADRPLKELCSVLNVKRRHVSKAYSDVMRLKAEGKLKLPKQRGRTAHRQSTAESFIERYVKALRLPSKLASVTRKVLQKIQALSLMGGKQPSTVAASALFLVIALHKNVTRTFKEIATVAGISDSTIQQSYKKFVYANRIKLVPKGYVPDENVEKLQLTDK